MKQWIQKKLMKIVHDDGNKNRATEFLARSVIIYPFDCARMMTSTGNFSLLGTSFRFKMMYGGNLPPSAITHNIIVTLSFS